MWEIIVLFLITILHSGSGVLYRINVTEFNRMPPQFRLDDYDKCLNAPEGVYCAVEFDLVSDTPSDLLTMIQEYSKHVVRHFNHTKPYHGICVTQTCQHFIYNKTEKLEKVLEGCLNETIFNEYGLKTKVYDNYKCTKSNEGMNINAGDICVVVLVGIIIMINLIASLYDFFYIKNTDRNANIYLINFSISRNCKKLVDVSSRPDPRQNRLKCLDGIKTISIALIIIGHSILPLVIFCQNIYSLETTQDNIFYQIIYNGTIIVQVFFVISGLLLAYNLQISTEGKALNWLEVPKRLGIRWLRLTPPYAVVLALSATWLRYAGSGPFWKISIDKHVTEHQSMMRCPPNFYFEHSEKSGMKSYLKRIVNDAVSDCSQYWWSHLIYINNYFNNGQCMPHVWYVAADFQLHILGLLVCVLCKGSVRRIVLGFLFVAGIIAPAIHTYLQDLNGTLVLTYEAVRTMFVTDPTFIHVYKPAHTNVPSFVIGLSLGLIIYHLQNNNFDIKKYKKYLPLYYALLPVAIAIILIGMVGYRDGPELSIYVRAVFAALLKPLFGATFALLIFGMVFKFENILRGFFEARTWSVLCRISYCAFICHEFFFRTLSGTSVMMRTDVIHLFNITLGNVFISFFVAVMLWLLVESPFLGVIDALRYKERTTSRKSTQNGAGNETKDIIEANTLL